MYILLSTFRCSLPAVQTYVINPAAAITTDRAYLDKIADLVKLTHSLVGGVAQW